jgi:uncharacterized membrane protein
VGRMSWAVALAAAVQAVCIATLAIIQHRNYGSWGFDFGIYDQVWWLTGQDGVSSASFITMRGMPVWGHHINAVFLLLAPFARLGFGAEFLIVVQAITLGLGALPLAWLARTKTGSVKVGAAFGLMYLSYPAVGWLGWLTFHPEALAITPLLFAAWFAHSRRYVRLAVSMVFALSCREDVGLIVGALGIAWCVMAIWNRRKNPSVKAELLVALMTTLVGFGWFFYCSKVLIPSALGSDVYYIDRFYAQYGSTMSEVAVNLATHPGTLAALSAKPQARTYLLDLFGPLGFASLLGLPVLSAMPQLVATIAADGKFVREIRFQYTALMVPGIMLGAVDTAAFALRRWRKLGKVILGWMLLCTCASALLRSPLPIGVGFNSWKLREPARASLDKAVALIPADATVAASDNITAHLSHRRGVYDFPNPFQWMIYGSSEADAASPDAADWIVVEPAKLGKKYQPVFDQLIATKTFTVVFEENGVAVARRTITKSG